MNRVWEAISGELAFPDPFWSLAYYQIGSEFGFGGKTRKAEGNPRETPVDAAVSY
jgi:hypothetical protein